MTTALRIDLDHMRLDGLFVSFETLRGLIDMLRFAGTVSIDYDGGRSFFLNVEERAAQMIIDRFDSFGILAEREEAKHE